MSISRGLISSGQRIGSQRHLWSGKIPIQLPPPAGSYSHFQHGQAQGWAGRHVTALWFLIGCYLAADTREEEEKFREKLRNELIDWPMATAAATAASFLLRTRHASHGGTRVLFFCSFSSASCDYSFFFTRFRNNAAFPPLPLSISIHQWNSCGNEPPLTSLRPRRARSPGTLNRNTISDGEWN